MGVGEVVQCSSGECQGWISVRAADSQLPLANGILSVNETCCEGAIVSLSQADLQVTTLGDCMHSSPLHAGERFVSDRARVLHDITYDSGESINPIGFEKAGPREKLFFDPTNACAAIVTCGGLCPGLNNVVRNLYYALRVNYRVPRVLGIRHGYQGLNPAEGLPPLELTDDIVESIHHVGGTILGTSRGPQDAKVTVDFLQSQGVNILLPIGGDGTQRGAHAIAQEVRRRKTNIAVVGIPKTIDNDIKYCQQTFGYISAVAEAERVIDRAHVEAKSIQRGIGIVKLMGREAGFIAAASTIASGEVNFTLIPEVDFKLNGPDGFLTKLERRLDARGHAVVVVAEGAGQHLLPDVNAKDASGNRKLGDIGPFLKQQVHEYFKSEGRSPAYLKYFDPSYYIRSVQAGATDSLLTETLARHAVHAAMAGKTDLFVGQWNGRTVHVPLELSCGQIKRLDPTGDLWSAVLATTGQEKW